RGLAVSGAALDRQPLAVINLQAQVSDRRNGVASFDVELGHVGELIHGPYSSRVVSAALMPPGPGRPRGGAWRSASFRTTPRPGPRPPRESPPPPRRQR